MTAFDYAIAHGSYNIALSLKKSGEKPKSLECYSEYNKLKKMPYFNYEMLLEYLEKEVQPELCPSFHSKPLEPGLNFN